MNLAKTVGVVIPIYNVEKYLKECLDSVINQTYTNLEIILVNDGSTDESSLNIAKEYTLKDKRITLFDKKNGGLSSARNVGIEYFSGEYKLNNRTQDIKENSLIEFDIEGRNSYEIHSVYKSCKAFKNKQELTNFTYPDIDYIIFLDSDDYWELNCIEECVPRMDGVEVVWFDWVYKHEISEYFCDETYQDLYGFKSGIISSTEWASKYSNVGRKWFIFAWHGMIDFQYLKSIKLKFVDNAIHEDICFGTLLFMYSKFIYVLRKKIYKYRIRENSICDRNENNNRAWINPYFRKAYLYFGSNVKKTKKYHKLYSVILSTCYLVEFINNNKKENSLDYSSIIRDRIDALWSALNSLTHDPLEAYKKIPKVLYKDRINKIIQDYEYKINIL
ncbi:glycosyltransferase family 2 protein, partial [Campylobacter coli]|nr:glycosyltransferase family 2 protein [Campylobacter coli]